MKKLPLHFLLLACVSMLSSTSLAEPLRHLFLDPAFVQQSEKVALRVNPAQQREIVIRADKPWEQLMISLFLTVLDDGGKLRMWYICRDKKNQPNVAYAESTDGDVDTAVLGHLRAGLLDADVKEIEGFGVEDCEVLRTNSTRALVTWKGGASLASLMSGWSSPARAPSSTVFTSRRPPP